jgi:hypothetical protein
LFLCGLLLPAASQADEPVPRYTYLGGGYEWGDAKCGIEPETEGTSGYTVEGSVGVLDFLHLVGAWYDGETDGEDLDVSCYEVGAGLSYGLREGTDVVLRGYWVRAELDDEDDDGFEPELVIRHMASEKAEIQVGMTYYDIGDDESTEVRASIVYNLTPAIALRAGGSVFDTDSSVFAGVRVYLGGNLF